LEERLKNLSITDPLTGVYNMRYFVERLEHEIGRFNRYGDQFSVIMLDLDHFKSINDDFGHDKGDEVLVGTVSTIKSRIRSIDVLARWGGEEFVLLLPSTDKEGAVALAKDLRLKLREKDYSIGRKVTASFGITSISLGDTVDTIMKRADDMLYTAKASGRDCVMGV
ncbi:MAG: GGDEF domain-containing protein, partial [Desulfatiglandales bacterium]